MCAGKEKPFYVVLQEMVCKQFSVQSLHALFSDRLTGLVHWRGIPLRSRWVHQDDLARDKSRPTLGKK